MKNEYMRSVKLGDIPVGGVFAYPDEPLRVFARIGLSTVQNTVSMVAFELDPDELVLPLPLRTVEEIVSRIREDGTMEQ